MCHKQKIVLTQPLLYLQVEGKGNGIKTVIVNMVDIAKALQRPASCERMIILVFSLFSILCLVLHCNSVNTWNVLLKCCVILSFTDPTKFFGCELGAQTQIDLKNERYIVNGAHHADKLQEILDGFIEKFVLCPDCENPETDLVR